MKTVFGALVAKKGEKRFFPKKCVFSLFLSQFLRYWFQIFRVCRYGYFALFGKIFFADRSFLKKFFFPKNFRFSITLWIAADVHSTFLSMKMVFGALVAKKRRKTFFFLKNVYFRYFSVNFQDLFQTFFFVSSQNREG